MWYSAVGCIVALALGLVLAPDPSHAQPPTHVHRIGYLSYGSPLPEFAPHVEAFRQGLRELGYVEGQNLVIEYRYAEGHAERLGDLAAELVRLPVEVIVVGGAPGIRAAQQATRTIPIVMGGTGDAVAAGFVASLAHPGGNITGLSDLSTELPGKRLELLKEMVPQSTRIAVLARLANSPYAETLMANLTVAARALGLHLQVLELRSAEELDSAFAPMIREGTDALLVATVGLPDSPLHRRIVDLAAQNRLPTMFNWRENVVAGGLMSYGISQRDIHRRTATYVGKILQGAKPADLPVEQPTKFDLVINLKTAKALGITVPPSLLLLADEVIQ